MWHLIALIAAGFLVHYTVLTSAQMTHRPLMPPVPMTPKWQPPEHDWELIVYKYPNSLTQPDRCNQSIASYLCDPKSLLKPEDRSVITNLLNAGGTGTSFISVAVVHKIKVLDASDLNIIMRAEANKILNNLAKSNQSLSKEGSLLFISVQDKQAVLAFTNSSTHRCIDLEHDNTTALFKSGQLSLSEYVSNVINVYINSKCRDLSLGSLASPGSLASASCSAGCCILHCSTCQRVLILSSLVSSWLQVLPLLFHHVPLLQLLMI